MVLLRLALLFILLITPGWARPYRIATTPWMGWAFLDVAEAKGFWRQAGIEVELVPFADGTSYLDAQLTGEVDFSCAMVGDVVWIHTHQAPVRILLETDWSLGGDKFFMRKGKRLQDLKGSPLGLYQARYALPFFLRKTLGEAYRHLLSSPAAIFSPEELVAQFRAGRLDAGVICDPFAGSLGSAAEIRATSADSPGSLPECLFGTRRVIDAMPAREMDALLRGILKAMDWARDPKNAVELHRLLRARSFRGLSPFTLEDMRVQARSAPIHSWVRLKARNAPRGGLEAYLGELRQFLLLYEPKEPPFRPRELFDAFWSSQALRRCR